jgi:hypothetical protein
MKGSKTMKKTVKMEILGAVALVSVGLAAPASAHHDHYLDTPGTCVEDMARGQTSQTSGGGAHQFHDNVHLGQPGMEAFSNPNNPVSMGKVINGVSCP